ncbi:hypothetical protein PoB_005370000 [Plakobranchus ocellatus]|uniref:Uncharacterized protein n=1 Tax=Plakobranchus ocellatus TaxID=259542 RepID=A0AAV4C6X2_9GAST|nr:hypothetical protein PoB_005370000 [Plakobranchus ocellatus]
MQLLTAKHQLCLTFGDEEGKQVSPSLAQLYSDLQQEMNYKETPSHLSGPRDEKRKTGTFGNNRKGKRSRGRQREKIMDGLATWLGTGKVLDTLTAVKDRDLWRNMIANAYKKGIQ